MFSRTIRFNGEYASILKKYCKANKDEDFIAFPLNNNEGKIENLYVFETMYQMFITAAIFGLIYHKREQDSPSKEVTATLFNEILVKNNSTIMNVYELMILSDLGLPLDVDKRIKKAFSPIEEGPESKEAEDYFLSFVRGGLLIIDRMFSKCSTFEDVANEISRIAQTYPLQKQ